MLSKYKKIRLTGKPLRELNEKIYERDNHHCVICETWIEEGVKFHHVIYKSHGGQDVEENGIMLCLRCHNELHSGKESQYYKGYCKEYLEGLYGTK
jgi:5-methylcytosine-specific restriction endonuclease McrA